MEPIPLKEKPIWDIGTFAEIRMTEELVPLTSLSAQGQVASLLLAQSKVMELIGQFSSRGRVAKITVVLFARK